MTSQQSNRDILPGNVVPLHYDVHFVPDMSSFTFAGTAKVQLQVQDDTSVVVLNAMEIEIQSAEIDGQKASGITYEQEIGRAAMQFAIPIGKGNKVELMMNFTGVINDKMAGFYRSSYVDSVSNEKKYLACTQMEATDNRRAFPSWDEPALKASFTFSFTTDSKYTILSNMNVASEVQHDNSRKTVTFHPTPLMSTYLCAWVIGELEYIETTTSGANMAKIPVRVYTTPGKSSEGRFSLDLAAKTLDFFSKTFDIPYPLPKLDMVAIPDFAAGAMENWGLVTYRVVDLLYDDKNSGAAVKERVAEVVQHELAHQWFGNLVTMDWWEGLWLNEGFATWMSWYSANHFYPDWAVWDKYVTDNLQGALRLDGLRSSHPIEVPVKTAEDINQIFDAISYSKGSCLIRMISKYLGEEVFISGIRKYLKRHAYGNTKTEDLWKALSEESGRDVSKIATIWTKKIGYPVVNVEERQGQLQLSQKRFLTTGDVEPEEDKTIYWLPLSLKTVGADGKITVDYDAALTDRTSSIPIDRTAIYKLNSGHSGIYRTMYSPEHLQKLGTLGPSFITVADRAGLVADAGALATSGYSKTSSMLNLIEGWKFETEFVVWSEIVARITAVEAAWIFEDEVTKAALENFKCQLVSPQAHKIGWSFSDNDDHVESQLKSLLFASAVGSKDVRALAAALDMFRNFAHGDTNAIHPNLRSAVFAAGIKHGSERDYHVLYDTFLDNNMPADIRYTALRSLGLARHDALIQKTLGLVLSDKVKDQDVYMIFAGLRQHREGIEQMWKYCTKNWSAIDKKIPNTSALKSSTVQSIVTGFTSMQAIEDIEKFFADKNTKAFDKGLAQAIDAVKAKAGQVTRDSEDIKLFLAKYTKKSEKL